MSAACRATIWYSANLAMPTNLVDPKSGQSYYQAMTQLATLMDLQHVSIANLPKIPFFENFWAKAGEREPRPDADPGGRAGLPLQCQPG
jgi:hypothetical protein